jgi:DHA1 family bicyclomycin/chloramphenicol resistance-like MFS transporter
MDDRPGATDTDERVQVTNRLRLILVLGALIAIGPLSIDMYLPALPKIAQDLHTPQSTIQLTLTGTLIGLGLGQLLVGPLSDAIGRRKPLIVGTSVHVVASLACLLAPNVVLLDVARVAQGLGASAGAVLAVAVARDLYTDRAAATLLSRLMLVLGVSPVLAPTLGGELLRWTHWRGVFAVLAGLGILITVVTALALPETLPARRRHPPRLRATLATYGGLLGNLAFISMIMVAGLAMAGLFGYVSGASFVFQQQFGMSQQQFGLFFGVSAVWLIAATQLNARLLRRYAPHQVLVVSGVAASGAGLGLLATSATGFGGLAGVVIPLWLVLFFCGLMMPNAPAVALSAHGEAAGTAAALLGAVQFGVGALVSPVVGVLGNNALAMALVIAVGVLLATLVLVLVARPWRLAGVAEREVVLVPVDLSAGSDSRTGTAVRAAPGR